MGVDELALARAARQRRIAARVVANVVTAWDQLDPSDLESSWLRIGKALVSNVSVAQTLVAADAARYVDDAVTEQGVKPARRVIVPPRAFAGTTADGRSLATLLYQAIRAAETRMAESGDIDAAMRYGRGQTTLYAVNEVQTAGRVADGVAIALEPRTQGYVRQVVLPTCGRCLLLAGKEFARNAGFERHPRCDCVHLPTIGNGPPGAQTPEELFARMTPEEQARWLGKANAEAIRAGGDIAMVVNARRGMRSAGDTYTNESTSRRGVMPGGSRYTPAALLKEHGEDPQRLAAALRDNGYLAAAR